jgi:hypothetical protein
MYNVNKSPVRDAATVAPGPLGSYGSDAHLERYGVGQIAYARTLVVLGHEKAAGGLLADAAARRAKNTYTPWNLKDSLTKAQKFAAGYEEAKAKLAELESALAKTPDGDKQWELVQLCSPQSGKEGTALERKLDIPLKRLEALLVMLSRHPEHRRVTGGEVRWGLYHTWRIFEMHEKCVEVLDEMMAKHQKDYSVRHGTAHWEKAESFARIGVLREEMGVRDALGAYRASVAAFEAFRKQFPKDSRCKVGESGTSIVQRRIAALSGAVARFSR